MQSNRFHGQRRITRSLFAKMHRYRLRTKVFFCFRFDNFMYIWQFNRIGTFYRDSDEPFDPINDCPFFWRDKKIKINPVNFTSEEYMDNIQITAFVGMGLNTAVIVAFFISFWSKIKKESGCDRLKLFAKIAYGFFWAFADSITGDLNIDNSYTSVGCYKRLHPLISVSIQMHYILETSNLKIFLFMLTLVSSKQWLHSLLLLYLRMLW